jgi:hypothetical protein
LGVIDARSLDDLLATRPGPDVRGLRVMVDDVPVTIDDLDARVDTRQLDGDLLATSVGLFSPLPGQGRMQFRRGAVVRAPWRGHRRLTASLLAGHYFFKLGRQDERLGHAAFDDRYIVKTNAPDELRYWLGSDECEAVLATYDPAAAMPFVLELTNDEVTFTGFSNVESRPTRPARLDRAAEAAAFLSARPRRLAEAWRTRLAPLGDVTAGAAFSVDGDFAIRIERGPLVAEVTFPDELPAVRRRGLRTMLTVRRREPSTQLGALWASWPARGRPPAALQDPNAGARAGSVRRRRRPDALAGGRARPGAAGARARAPPDAVWIEPTAAALRWERIVDDVDALGAGLDVLDALTRGAAATDGPYR